MDVRRCCALTHTTFLAIDLGAALRCRNVCSSLFLSFTHTILLLALASRFISTPPYIIFNNMTKPQPQMHMRRDVDMSHARASHTAIRKGPPPIRMRLPLLLVFLISLALYHHDTVLGCCCFGCHCLCWCLCMLLLDGWLAFFYVSNDHIAWFFLSLSRVFFLCVVKCENDVKFTTYNVSQRRSTRDSCEYILFDEDERLKTNHTGPPLNAKCIWNFRNICPKT